jgi:hypothetical protein
MGEAVLSQKQPRLRAIASHDLEILRAWHTGFVVCYGATWLRQDCARPDILIHFLQKWMRLGLFTLSHGSACHPVLGVKGIKPKDRVSEGRKSLGVIALIQRVQALSQANLDSIEVVWVEV